MDLVPTYFGNVARRRDPFSMLRSFEDMFDRSPLFDNGDTASFALNVEETDRGYLVEADVPGIKRDEIEVSLDNRTLTISIHKADENEQKKRNFVHMESRLSSASRSLYLPNASTTDEVSAHLTDGVLTVDVKKAADKKAHRVKIS
ncbi:MAG: Hsp20/alpha crystallin family protein [Bdellovibrionales bacterium]|nr:Hsp20/alpha crystallin family protein [Bdellovibrionales bacterium]